MVNIAILETVDIHAFVFVLTTTTPHLKLENSCDAVQIGGGLDCTTTNRSRVLLEIIYSLLFL